MRLVDRILTIVSVFFLVTMAAEGGHVHENGVPCPACMTTRDRRRDESQLSALIADRKIAFLQEPRTVKSTPAVAVQVVAVLQPGSDPVRVIATEPDGSPIHGPPLRFRSGPLYSTGPPRAPPFA
ncbi:MAG: hypothetical protein JSS66_17590 [Armatimonadetes bacterium]|nr:hypothetical protein [Armatimonadota bacterium]